MAHRADGLSDIFENDVIIRKKLTTKEGSITKTPTDDIDITNKKYVDALTTNHPHQDVKTTASPAFVNIYDGQGDKAIDINSRKLTDINCNASVDWNDRKLYNTNGSSVVLDYGAGSELKIDNVETNEILSTSSLLINKNASQNVELFSATDVADAVDGKHFKIHRKASEFDYFADIFLDNNGYVHLDGSRSNIYFLGSIGDYSGILKSGGSSKWSYLDIGNNNGGTFRCMGDGADSIFMASYNNLIFGWDRGNSTADINHTITFAGYNNTHDEHLYFEVGGLKNHSVNGDTRYVDFSPPKVMMSNIPTSDPTNAGQLWVDSGTVKVSAG